MILIELDYFFWLFFANFSSPFRVPPRKNTWISPIFRGPKRTSHQNLQIRFGFRSRTKFGGSTSCRLILVEGQGHNPRGWSWKGWVKMKKRIQICSFHDFEHRRISRNKKKGFQLRRRALFESFRTFLLTFQENYNTPLEHTPGNPPTQLWKDSLYNLLVKVKGCAPKVCWNNLRDLHSRVGGGAQELKFSGIVWRHRIEKCA